MKNPLVSVVVPTKNSQRFLERCLESIKTQTYKNIEIIVVDNNSTDKTKQIAKKYSKLVFNKGPERNVQRNYGASEAVGSFLLFVDSDMELSEKVIEECVDKFRTENLRFKIGGIIIPEESFGEGFWAECKRLERSFYLRVSWIEAARFFPKKVFIEFNGYDKELISGEDWDINQRIKSRYGISRITGIIKHNEGKLSLRSLLEKKRYYGTKIRKYSSKKENGTEFENQSSIIKRYKLFLSHPFKLFENPFVGLGMLFMKTSEFGAGAVGYLFKK